MRKNRIVTAAMLCRAAVVLGLALVPGPALAQYIGGSAPPLPAPLRPGEVQTPAGALARALRTLAQSPRDFPALITAGRAAVELGDTQAAIGFFGRAEEVRPSDPAPKIGMGAATVITGDASGALRWFFEAQRLGATSAALGADRGLAQDLLGNQPSAQTDYRAALGGREADEARRRLALSLGISGDRSGAFAALQPLIARRDPAVQRIRAFVLALVGDERGASGAIDQAMPGAGPRMAGFFRLLPTLTAPQKAAAVHLGVFPEPSEIRVAAVSPRTTPAPAAPTPAPRTTPIAVGRRVTVTEPPPRIAALDPVRSTAANNMASVRPDAAPPATTPVLDPTPLPLPPPAPDPSTAATPQAGFSTSAAVSATTVPLDAPVMGPANPNAPDAPATVVAEAANSSRAELDSPVEGTGTTLEPAPLVALSADRLSGIDRLLARADELPVPPPSRPRVEQPKVAVSDSASTKKASDLKKVADARKAADQKKATAEEAERESIGLAGTNWIQLAGGSYADRMAGEFRRLGAKSPALRKRGGAVTAGKEYFRLLTGPFATRAEAQLFVNQLAKDGVDGFSWTRTPATLKIEKLPPK